MDAILIAYYMLALKIVLDLGFFYFMDFLSPASFVPNN
jgi:hypothetical protein